MSDRYKTLINNFESWVKDNNIQSDKIVKSLRESLKRSLERELNSEREERYFDGGE